MANRPKTERNRKILILAEKGWLHQSIANQFKMKLSAVEMVLYRHRQKEKGGRQ